MHTTHAINAKLVPTTPNTDIAVDIVLPSVIMALVGLATVVISKTKKN
ncbi:MAG: hypothetical protein J6T39_00500 [Clostridia bacterium]|nr:hypothetical protein [Clostridia bacterium]